MKKFSLLVIVLGLIVFSSCNDQANEVFKERVETNGGDGPLPPRPEECCPTGGIKERG